MTKICEDCERPLRTTAQRAADYPGTVAGWSGICNFCRGRRERGESVKKLAAPGIDSALMPTAQDRTPITIAGLDSDDADVRHVARQAQDFLEARRRRGVPPQGIDAQEVPA